MSCITSSTSKSYASSRSRYLDFCSHYKLPHWPFSECLTCLFATFLTQQGLQLQSFSVYLLALRHLEVSAGFDSPLHAVWPSLQYVLRGIKRSQDSASNQVCPPITATIMHQLRYIWRYIWANEFPAVNLKEPRPILVSAVAVDFHTNPAVVKVFLQRARLIPSARECRFIWARLTPLSAPFQQCSTTWRSAAQVKAPSLFTKLATPSPESS